MADEQQQNETQSQSASNAASTAASAAIAAGKAATGNVIGAAADVVKDHRLRNAIISIILCISLLITSGAMLIGSAITGTVEDLAQSWSENWDQNWEEQGIASNGSALYQYTIGALVAADQALLDTITGLFTSEHKQNGIDATNQSIDASTLVGSSDYETTIKSIFDEDSLTGADGALMKRLEMIKGRVEQRGKQIATMATAQYAFESIGLSIATILIEQFDNPILYNGVDWANCSVTVDTSAFRLSDLQALKILAAYSIQHDCDLTSVDMYDLMDYCGWYDVGFTTLAESSLGDENIYQTTSLSTVVSQEIGGVVGSGDTISYQLSAPKVPYWRGTFAPQWYYEEIAQIKNHNNAYFISSATKQEEMIPWGVSHKDDEIDLSAFTKLANYETYGIIDKLFTSGTAQLTVSRTEYHGADEWADEALAKFTGSILRMWNDTYGEKELYTDYDNHLTRDTDGNQTFRLKRGETGATKEDIVHEDIKTTYRYYLQNASNGAKTAKKAASYSGATISWTNIKASTKFNVYEETTVYTKTEDGEFVQKNKTTELIDSFKTFSSGKGSQAYQLQLEVRISYAPRSFESLTKDLMGLWPNSFQDTETGADGREYAVGHADEENLALTWTDTYTAPDGSVHTLSFERQFENQISAYQNIVEGTGEILGIDTSSLYALESAAGSDIVAMANAEYEYYHANGLSGGMRYWNMVKDVLGGHLGYDAPWCVAFVYCCAYQCGYIGEGAPFGPNWIFYVDGAFHEITTNGIAQGYRSAADDYKPVPGDLVVFALTANPSSLSHIGIVEYVEESGELHTIHGNANNSVLKSEYPTYQIGALTHPYSDTVIAGYIHPEYPTAQNEPVFMSISSTVGPTVNSRYITSGSYNLMLNGITRLRTSQLPTFIAELKQNYPDLYTQALEDALASRDMEAFRKEWNAISSSLKSAAFREAQIAITESVYLEPLAANVKSATGFDWTSSWARRELLWGLATTTDRYDALAEVLAAITSGMDVDISDKAFLEAMKEDNHLGNILNRNIDALWPDETQKIQFAWISSINKLVDKLLTTNVVISAANLSTACTEEEERQIWNALLEMTGNPYGAAGMMGNLYAESGLLSSNMEDSYEAKLGFTNASYTIAVDNGTYTNFVDDAVGYGLAQWTFGPRKENLYNLARERRTSISNLTVQLELLKQELNGSYSGVMNILKSATSVLEASNIVLHVFENPAVQTEAVERQRASFGQHFYEKYVSGFTSSGTVVSGNLTNMQIKVINIAMNSAQYGIEATAGYCQRWAALVYAEAGLSTDTSCCAYHSGQSYGVSSDWDIIPPGAAVYGYSGSKYGHVGIYVGNGKVYHNVGGVAVDTLTDWIRKYRGFSWGWQAGSDLTKYD